MQAAGPLQVEVLRAGQREQRLRAAQSLLETTDHTVDQVAQESGFGNAAALRAHFGRRLRTTPTAYRRTFAGGQGAS